MHRVHFNPLWGKHPDELWRSERTPSRVSSEEGGTDGVYADGSLRANARYPGHVRSANRTYCRAHDSSGHFNISAECAEKTVERGPDDEKTKGKERKKRRMREGEGVGDGKMRGRGRGREKPEARNRYATVPLVLVFRPVTGGVATGNPLFFIRSERLLGRRRDNTIAPFRGGWRHEAHNDTRI